MEYSKQGLALTERFEGCRLEAYQDSGGIWTIGFGHTKGVSEGMITTVEEATAWLEEDIAWAASEVNRIVSVTLTQGEFDALVDFTFNCGRAALDHSTLLELVNQGNMEAAAEQFERWDKVGGKEVAGLLRRRQAERAEFESEG
jgi:lysozyme